MPVLGRPVLTKRQECGFILIGETLNIGVILPQKLRHFLRAAVSTANPDNLRRRAEEHTEAVKVLILTYKQAPMCLGKLPNCRPTGTDLPNVQRVGKDIVEQS